MSSYGAVSVFIIIPLLQLIIINTFVVVDFRLLLRASMFETQRWTKTRIRQRLTVSLKKTMAMRESMLTLMLWRISAHARMSTSWRLPVKTSEVVDRY